MEGSEISHHNRSWVEDIYWNHFQFLHFAKFMPSSYNQHLALPKAFYGNLKKKLPENVSLRGPGGALWNIGLTTREDTLYFTHGWKQFVKDHSLIENDFLVFKFNGESTFDVLIFDGKNFCEKAAAYFVRNVGNGNPENGIGRLTMRKDTENSNAGVECASPQKSVHVNSFPVPDAVPVRTEPPSERNFNGDVEFSTPKEVVNVDGDAGVEVDANGVTMSEGRTRTTGKRIRKPTQAFNHFQTKRRPVRVTKTSNAHKEVANVVIDADADADPEPVSAGKSEGGNYELYVSQRRPVTEEEMNSTLQMAKAACTDDSLCVVMRPTHVYKRFFVSLPNKWILQHIPPRTQDIILRVVHSEWLAKYSYHNPRNTGGLSGGWKRFTLDNNLEEYDVCVFKPGGLMNNTLILDVNIFRVVEEIKPLTQVRAAGSAKKSGKKKALKAIQI
ncbi:B3 domain-containing protein REM16 [Arachis stenosperma]|uniref:B3 domain-containing protein REM16 n=1 Tax=Arachis stenosperma TaxID=217475 RepID=UPI0025AC5CFA|nr:B3 domain-containing protein REM16 [Arachis stenosperma]